MRLRGARRCESGSRQNLTDGESQLLALLLDGMSPVELGRELASIESMVLRKLVRSRNAWNPNYRGVWLRYFAAS